MALGLAWLAVLGVSVFARIGPLRVIRGSFIALPFVFDAGNAALAFVVAIVINLAFVSWPARRAARLDPIVALRHA